MSLVIQSGMDQVTGPIVPAPVGTIAPVTDCDRVILRGPARHPEVAAKRPSKDDSSSESLAPPGASGISVDGGRLSQEPAVERIGEPVVAFGQFQELAAQVARRGRMGEPHQLQRERTIIFSAVQLRGRPDVPRR